MRHNVIDVELDSTVSESLKLFSPIQVLLTRIVCMAFHAVNGPFVFFITSWGNVV